ncbi:MULTISPECIES: hypothetical protein [Rhizobium/Agrobacterium group]|uniref:hypothetical protein n=1 Tax=Rhizobium/Agrobacterium group TaxID=227290 RepID=UPI0008763EC4|nr:MULTISPECIES: hypothetical protein [Rhizobium/Agrobacterium group]MBA8799239.1 hypothetical protein [Agrobacterium sp. RC10-4-1]SCY04763.1 hypothetical protein SAMN03159288_01143 [Rhizobium sp. NFACC06-2]
MEILTTVWAWLLSNWETLLAIAFAVEVVAVQIVNLTPTPVDNKALVALHKVLVFVANIVPNTKVQANRAAADQAMKSLK